MIKLENYEGSKDIIEDLLDILSQQNELGASIFGKMFQRNHPNQILKFLDEETSFLEDLKIQLKMPIRLFINALLKRIF